VVQTINSIKKKKLRRFLIMPRLSIQLSDAEYLTIKHMAKTQGGSMSQVMGQILDKALKEYNWKFCYSEMKREVRELKELLKEQHHE
jgi:hypothetical protein